MRSFVLTSIALATLSVPQAVAAKTATTTTTSSSAAARPTGRFHTSSTNKTVNGLWASFNKIPQGEDGSVYLYTSKSRASNFSIDGAGELTSPEYPDYLAAMNDYDPEFAEQMNNDMVGFVPSGQAVQGGLAILSCGLKSSRLSCKSDMDVRNVSQACGLAKGQSPYLIIGAQKFNTCEPVNLTWCRSRETNRRRQCGPKLCDM